MTRFAALLATKPGEVRLPTSSSGRAAQVGTPISSTVVPSRWP